MADSILILTDSQKDIIIDLDIAMKNLFAVFVRVDAEGIQIADALDLIGMEVPAFIKPAINQLSGKLAELKEGSDGLEELN
jgi:hypothetical protein